MNKVKSFIALLFVLLIFFAIYSPLLKLYISQDDFFHFKVSLTDGSFADFLKLLYFRSFETRGGIYFYRPIYREILYNFFYRQFGLAALPFRTLQYLMHIANILLVFGIVKRITSSTRPAIFGTLFFAITAPTLGIISYLAGGIQVSGALFFYLVSLHLYSFFLNKKKFYFYLLSVLFYMLALASHELAISLPLIIAALKWTHEDRHIYRSYIYQLLPYAVISLIYISLEKFIIGFPTAESQYVLNFSPVKLLNSYIWYGLWSIGTPEMLVDFIGPGVRLNPNLMRYWSRYYVAIFPLMLILLVILFFTALAKLKDKHVRFFAVWFAVALLPVVFQPSHRLYYYLGISLVGMAGVFGICADVLSRSRKIWALNLVFSFIALTIVSTDLSKTNYWAITRANIAEAILSDVKTLYPSLPKASSVYFLNDPDGPAYSAEWGGSAKQAAIILSGADALQLVYRDRDLKVYYEDLENPPDGVKYYPVIAKIYR